MENINYAFAEVLDILEHMDEKYINKIPEKLIKLFKDNASTEYKKHINSYHDLKDVNLNKDTIKLLALIKIKYWSNKN